MWGRLEFAERREWLVTDGHGGYASGTVSGVLTRRYHGLLVAAIAPPLGRRVLFSKIDAVAAYAGRSFDLGANRWRDGTIAPSGYALLSDFAHENGVPVWTYAFADAVLQQRVWMDTASSTYVSYALAAASEAVTLKLKCYVEDRDFHTLTHAYDVGNAVIVEGRCATIRLASGTIWYLAIDRGTLEAANEWYYGFRYAAETGRGLDDLGDAYHAVTIGVTLQPGESVAVHASLDPRGAIEAEGSRRGVAARDASLLAAWKEAVPSATRAPAWMESLVLAADRFIVERAGGTTIVAGYHWFGDWGRDTMIALPGLALATGRYDVARSILLTFARYVDRGMIPNRFPDAGTAPEYNTVDAPLWYIEAVRSYVACTNDTSLLSELFDALDSIVDWYLRGTRYGIAVDSADGLLRAGEPGVQLTWMDAKVGDWVVTPRIGKPVEVNALWYNALCSMDGFAQQLTRDPSRYRACAGTARLSFARFWNAGANYLYDVLDGPSGDDASIRPNAVFAAALPFRALDTARESAIVREAARSLLTTFGLRSLAPSDPAYVGCYEGPPQERDAAYHRGTVWPWLIGPFVRAWTNAFETHDGVERFIEPFAARMQTYGMGTLAEIADGNAPYVERGCIAQAWSVGQVLQTWHELERGEG